VDYSLTAAKADRQFKRAQELKAACAIKLDRSPSGELLARIKNLRTREERSVNPTEAASQVRASSS
jgi:histidyl-tRNA synthetase